MTMAASPTPWSCVARQRPRRTPPDAGPGAHRHPEAWRAAYGSSNVSTRQTRSSGVEQTFADTGAPDGDAFEEIAELLPALGRAKEAQPHFARAAETLGTDGGGVRSQAARLKRLQGLDRG